MLEKYDTGSDKWNLFSYHYTYLQPTFFKLFFNNILGGVVKHLHDVSETLRSEFYYMQLNY